MVLLLPLIGAAEIQYSINNITWINITSVDDGDNEGYQTNLQPGTLYYFRGRNGTSDWNYTSQRTKMAGEGIMASLGVILFVNALAFVIFLIAFKARFTDSEFANYIIKRCFVLFGLFLTSLNTVIVVTIADNTGLGVNRELFRYLWMINWAIYVGMVALFVGSVWNGLKLWKKLADQKRMGYEEGDYE